MHFALTDDQSELVSTVRQVIARNPETAWDVLVEQVGAPALAVPEEYDGAGAGLVETTLVLTELGAALTPNPLLSTALATVALLEAGHTEPLAEIAAGRSAAIVWESGSATLDGSADLLLTVRDGLLHRVDQATPTPLVGVDLTLDLAQVDVEDSTPLGPVDLPRLQSIGAALTTAIQVGVMRRSLELTVEYTQQRVQFGRTLASYQALKHRMADCHVLVETSQSVSWAACWAAATNAPDLAVQASTAKAWCGDAGAQVASELVQLHGGIAITWEHPAHTYFKRAAALNQLFGQPHEHRAVLAG